MSDFSKAIVWRPRTTQHRCVQANTGPHSELTELRQAEEGSVSPAAMAKIVRRNRVAGGRYAIHQQIVTASRTEARKEETGPEEATTTDAAKRC